MGTLADLPATTSAFYDDGYYGRGPTGGNGYVDYEVTAEHGLLWTKLVVEMLAPAGGAVLDIGCADGSLLRRLVGAYRRFGIEVNPAAAERATASGVTIIGSDILDAEVTKSHIGAIDMITAIATYEHVMDFKAAFGASLAMLAPRGVLIYEVPLISETRDNTQWYTSSYEHIYYPTVQGLTYLSSCFPEFHFTGFETDIAGFGSTYIGMATRDPALHSEIVRLISVMTRTDLQGLSEADTILNLSYNVVHAFQATPERILRLPLLLSKQFSVLLATRLMQMWHADAVRASAAHYHEEQARNWEAEAHNWEAQARNWEAEAGNWEAQARNWETQARDWQNSFENLNTGRGFMRRAARTISRQYQASLRCARGLWGRQQ